MLIEALGTYIKQLGEKTYNILSKTINDEPEVKQLHGVIADEPPVIMEGDIPDDLKSELGLDIKSDNCD